LLLAATIRKGTEIDDAISLLNYFAPIAASHPVLQNALPLWREQQARLEKERKAEWLQQQEQQRLKDEHQKAILAVREAEFQAIEANGPATIVRAILDAPTLSTWDCSQRLAKIPEKALSVLPREMLDQIAHKIASQPRSKPWNGLRSRIEHLQKSRDHSEERSRWLAQLDHLPFREKLRAACDSRWSLTYFPANWAEQLLHETAALPVELRLRMLAKLMRLRRRNLWLGVRRMLLTQMAPIITIDDWVTVKNGTIL
jgi:hypothetical protein